MLPLLLLSVLISLLISLSMTMLIWLSMSLLMSMLIPMSLTVLLSLLPFVNKPQKFSSRMRHIRCWLKTYTPSMETTGAEETLDHCDDDDGAVSCEHCDDDERVFGNNDDENMSMMVTPNRHIFTMVSKNTSVN